MSRTTKSNLQTRPAWAAAWTGSAATTIDLLPPTGAPLGRPAAMARLDAARPADVLGAPTR